MTDGNTILDTNILVYAIDSSEGNKHDKAKRILQECFTGKQKFFVTTQILSEFFVAATTKIKKPIPVETASEIVESFVRFNFTPVLAAEPKNLVAAIHTHQTTQVHYWDCLIAETMKANGVFTIFTENTEDFQKISGIKAKNPFE